jgi:hypothetical protein
LAFSQTRDGYWWLAVPQQSKVTYITGMLDGMFVGNIFSSYELMTADDPCLKKVDDSFHHSTALTQNITAQQIRDGLDAFYKVEHNRFVPMHFGMWIVVNQIAGTPKAQIDLLLESLRKSHRQ